MKKSIILLAALIISFSAFSQQRTRSFMGWHLAKDAPSKLNEVKLNLGTAIFTAYPEVSYERILKEDISVGVSAGINLTSDEYPLNFGIIPYFRWFFGGNSNSLQKYGAGFFIEANGGVFNTRYEKEIVYYDDYTQVTSSSDGEFGAGLGLGVGWKYVSANNWVGEFLIGGGRDFVNDGAYPRMGITIGKRF